MIFLKGLYFQWGLGNGLDGRDAGCCGAEGCHNGDAIGHGSAADDHLILTRLFAAGSINDELHFPIFDHIDDMGASLREFVETVHYDAGFREKRGGSVRGKNFKSQSEKIFDNGQGCFFIGILDADKKIAS